MRRDLAPAVVAALLVACSGGGDDAVTTAPTTTEPVTATALTTTAAPSTRPSTTSSIPTTTDPPAEVATSSTIDTSPVLASGAGWELTENELAGIASFAAAAYGRDFTTPVGLEVLGPTGVTDGSEVGTPYITAEQWAALEALGLLDEGADFDRANALRRERIRGTCCQGDGDDLRVVVEDAGSEAMTKVVIAHELVHALVTQLSVGTPIPDAAFEELVPAFTTSFEGVPQWVATEYLASLTDDERASVGEELPILREQERAEIPDAAARIITFAYDLGVPLVDAVVAAHGADGAREVMGRVPVSSEQVVFPDAYLAEDEPVAVDPVDVPPDGQPIFTGRLGSMYLLFLAEQVADADEAARLVRPWAGDSVAVWTSAAGTCLRADVLMDTTAAAGELGEALGFWAEAQPAASVAVAGDRLTIEACR